MRIGDVMISNLTSLCAPQGIMHACHAGDFRWMLEGIAC